ncbi:hypothetical protein J0910_24445 [Nocardiopsis sp. CNT-189]|uniref:hypothetical protein n=1 Tax=Nocardiopsis oceanisediminis TaxID=2816862 RepID=UPI003B344C92
MVLATTDGGGFLSPVPLELGDLRLHHAELCQQSLVDLDLRVVGVDARVVERDNVALDRDRLDLDR